MDIRPDDYAIARRMIDLWRRATDLLLYGDYDPLTPSHRSAEEWVAWQSDRQETAGGSIQGIRLPECPRETLTVRLHGIRPDAVSECENAEVAER